MNPLALLKGLAPGFLPLVIFIIADSVWGTVVGLIVAVAFGIAEALAIYVKDKKLDGLVLADTGLIVLLGGISLALGNDIFFKLKPALIEAVLAAVLGISAFSGHNLVWLLSRRYLKNLTPSAPQLSQLRRGARTLFFLVVGHTALIIFAAFLLSRRWWAFVSGGLFYILFAAYFVAEFVRGRRSRKRWLRQYEVDEWLDLVDKDGQVTGRAPRTLCHAGKGMLHPVVHLHVLDASDRIFLQKRPLNKQIQPGKWDTAVGGHVLSGEKIEQALQREAAEELNLREFKARPVARYVWESDVESELVFMFAARTRQAITGNRMEMDEGKFWKVKKIREFLGAGIFTANFEFEFDILIKALQGGLGEARRP